MLNVTQCHYCKVFLAPDEINYFNAKILCPNCRDIIELYNHKDHCDSEWHEESNFDRQDYTNF